MSRPATCQKNSSQQPGLIMLEGKQKRHTSEQKQADNAQAQIKKLEKLTAQRKGLEHVANLMDGAVQDKENKLANRPKPWPCIVVVKPLVNSEQELSSQLSLPETEPSSMVADLGSYHAADEFLGDGPDEGSNYGQEEEAEPDKPDNDSDSETDESDGAPLPSQWQKSTLQEAVKSTGISSHADHSVAGHPEKVKQHSAPRLDFVIQQNEDVSGTKGLKNWAKSIKSNVIKTLPSQSSSVSAHRTKSTSSGAPSRLRAPHTTPATTHLSTSTGDALSSMSLDSEPYLQGSDQTERVAIKNSRRAKSVVHEVSGSEPGEWVLPPPITLPTPKKCGKKQRQLSEGDGNEPKLPPSKWARPLCRLGSGAHNKYRIKNLPPGATLNNMWRRVFISTIAYFAGSYHNPWSIPTDELVAVLQQIWDAIYVTGMTEDIEHTVTTSGAVYHLAHQALSNWRNGFGVAALAVVTTFFTNDSDCVDADNRQLFASTMLHKGHFLFDNNEGDNPEEWTGLWLSPFVLQMFAHHFNFTAGRKSIKGLDNEACTALVLSGTAVHCVLKHVSDKQITFEVSPSSSAWTGTFPRGNQYEFNNAIWGSTTRHYLEAVKQIPDDVFAAIVTKAHTFVKKTPSATVDLSADDDDSEFENIASYC